ncbi:FHA domain-containing protein [Microbacterium flavum]|nr:FHA domain-containing protein [Microbacterium flavum]
MAGPAEPMRETRQTPERAQTRYRPAHGSGAWWVAVEGAALAVLAPAVTARTADAVWRRVGEGGIGAVLDALTGAFGTSLTAIPPFALAIAEEGGIRVAVRGALELVIDGPDGPVAVTGEGVSTWSERFVAGAIRATAAPAGDPAEEAGVPLRSGVALADVVVLTVASDARVAAQTRVAPEIRVAPPAARELTPPAAPHAVPVASSSTPAPAPAPQAEPEEEPTEDAGAADEPADAAPASADTLLPAATYAPELAAEEAADEYDLLWGETVARPVAAAASAAAPEADAASAPAADAAAAPEGDGAEGGPEEAAAVEGEPEEEAAPATRVSETVTGERAGLGDHDGATISVAEARALRASDRERFESTEGIPPRRPTRGRIVLSTGRVVELERPVVIGRRPKSTRTSGADLPTLVAVDSPDQDISRSHVEIRAEGEHVLATDLDTTNGTLLLRGGQDPVRLHPSEPTMVVTGDVLDLGDGVTVTFEDLP